MKKRAKVLVTGAAGQIGYALIFRIASGAMLGPETEIELQLLELEAALPSLEGVAMELDDCAFPLLRNVITTSDINKAAQDANLALLVGAVPRKAGMERSDLLKINGGIFTAQGRALNDHAADDVKVFIVGNPCNTNCLIAMNNAPDIPNSQFFAMTSLDENRAKAQLAQKAQVGVGAVSNMTIWGNHSASQYPDFYHARIDGKPVPEVIADHAWLQQDFIRTVQQRGATVIKARGASSAASAANAALEGMRWLHTDTKPDDTFSMCVCSEGQYGVDPGLIFSLPCRSQQGQLSVVEGIEHNPFAQEKIDYSLQELRQERDAVKALGLIE